MRIQCKVSVANRTLVSVKSQNKHVKATLALCKHPNTDEFFIILFTDQNKNGTRYKVLNNIQSVFMKFVNDGKATIQLIEPPHDLYIQADRNELGRFLQLLKMALKKIPPEGMMKLSSMSVTATPRKDIAPKKLIVNKRSDLPTKGYPRTLESVFINGIKLCKMSFGILQLQNLKELDLSDNLIEHLPKELKNLPITALNVSKNQLYKSNRQQWDWIGGVLLKTLQTINLSHNDLLYIPKQFIKYSKLVNINLESNKLSVLPEGFGNIRTLRILNISYNNIKYIPGSMSRLHLEHLYISGNQFQAVNVTPLFPKPLPVCTLKEIAARKVLYARLSYSPEDLPITLIDFLDDAHYCVCGKACFHVYLHHNNILMLKNITQGYVSLIGDPCYVPIECFYCSLKCFKRCVYYPRVLPPLV